ncbi:hypothetical protein VMCG_08238 [Cytospora schulzeri]|uniref:CCHC-type domain-containing protein n=1 Tax=Cytospora schulzeri TaxID=448051 RepID=A0A423VSH0_9PEZI|nr:hypothetical protein VMCG_08238 [Valsa malicola]
MLCAVSTHALTRQTSGGWGNEFQQTAADSSTIIWDAASEEAIEDEASGTEGDQGEGSDEQDDDANDRIPMNTFDKQMKMSLFRRHIGNVAHLSPLHTGTSRADPRSPWSLVPPFSCGPLVVSFQAPEVSTGDTSETQASTGDGTEASDSGEDQKDPEESTFPAPATYAQQLKLSLPHRWTESGNLVVSLSENFRQVHDLLADADLNGRVMIIAPYQAQIDLYEWELSRRCAIELDSSNKPFAFDRSRVYLCTHQFAQGAEADVVFVDLVGCDMPGMTGEPKLVNVVSSRAIHAHPNTHMFEKLQDRGLFNAPHVRGLHRIYLWQQQEGACVNVSSIECRIMCNLCYKTGHKKKDCPSKTNNSLVCPVPGCMVSYYPFFEF